MYAPFYVQKAILNAGSSYKIECVLKRQLKFEASHEFEVQMDKWNA